MCETESESVFVCFCASLSAPPAPGRSASACVRGRERVCRCVREIESVRCSAALAAPGRGELECV